MAELNETGLAALAREMAMNIRNYKAVFADFGITEEDYYEICKNEFFKKAKEQIALEWNSTGSTADRIRLQGQAGTEVLMPVAIRRALEATTPLDSVLDTLKMTAKIGGIGDKVADAQSGAEKFVITINLGADVEGKPMVEHYEKPIAIELNPLKPEK
jgi:hypothetical protein